MCLNVFCNSRAFFAMFGVVFASYRLIFFVCVCIGFFVLLYVMIVLFVMFMM